MYPVFKKIVNKVECMFYRTISGNEIVYFVMYGNGTERHAVKVVRSIAGEWIIAHGNVPDFMIGFVKEIFSAMKENENS